MTNKENETKLNIKIGKYMVQDVPIPKSHEEAEQQALTITHIIDWMATTEETATYKFEDWRGQS